jgi:glutathione reductase (NADPH)
VDQAAEPITVDTILCATGRKPKPNLDPLCLENAGVKIERDYIPVGKDNRTNIPHIFAVGDCTDRINLTPVAIAEGRVFADTEFGKLPRSISYQNIPSAIFSQPEGGTVGFTETEAKNQLGEENIQIYSTTFRPLFNSLTDADEKVMVKLVVEKKYRSHFRRTYGWQKCLRNYSRNCDRRQHGGHEKRFRSYNWYPSQYR